MNYTSISDVLYADACLVFMVTGVICAAIRWFHMCRPYNENEDYFYPARKQVTFFLVAIAMQFPYFLNPSDSETWCYIRTFGVIFYPVCYAMLFSRYFHWQKLSGWNNWLFFGGPMLLLAAGMIYSMADHPNWLYRQFEWIQYVIGTLSILLTMRLLRIIRALQRSIHDYHLQNYSTEEDFPYLFAEKILWIPLIWIAFAWGIFLSGSRDFKALIDIVLAVWMVVFLSKILHPQRIQHPAGIEEKVQKIEEEEKALAQECIIAAQEEESAYKMDAGMEGFPVKTEDAEVVHAVLAVILRKYKEQHLLKSEVLAEIDKGMIAPANRFIAQVGYYNLINMFRLRHAQLYIEAHPEAKLAEVALESGFLSGSAFSKAKKSVKHIHPEYVANVIL